MKPTILDCVLQHPGCYTLSGAHNAIAQKRQQLRCLITTLVKKRYDNAVWKIGI